MIKTKDLVQKYHLEMMNSKGGKNNRIDIELVVEQWKLHNIPKPVLLSNRLSKKRRLLCG